MTSPERSSRFFRELDAGAEPGRRRLLVKGGGGFCLSVDWAASMTESGSEPQLIRQLASGKYRLYSKKKDPKTGKRRNLGTFNTRAAAEKHERAVQFFKRRG